MARDPTKAEIERLTRQWSGEFKANAEELIRRIIDLIDQGVAPTAAVNQAFNDSDFAARNRAALNDSLFQAAAFGAGIAPEIVSSKKAAIVEKINTSPWAPDRMLLSTRLHGTDAAMKAVIGDVIKQNMDSGTAWVKLARELYDGYGYGQVMKTTDLPAYLRRLEYYAKKTLSMGLQPDTQNMYKYNKALQRAENLIDGMAANDAPNRALKTAYKQLLDAAKDFSTKALDKAVKVAVQERSRYFAERIARTEIARAWADGFFAETYNDTDVVAYRWRLSSRHPKFDICDVHAMANLYGLGAGVYPKNKMPPMPAHPHCTCHLEEVFDGELDGLTAKTDAEHLVKAGRKWLKGLDESQQRDLLGPAGVKALKNGEDWRQHLRNWHGHTDPAARLSKRDFE